MLSTYPLPQSRSKSNTGLPVRAKPTKSGGLLSAFPSPHRLRTKGHLHAKFSPSTPHYTPNPELHTSSLRKVLLKCLLFPDGLGAGEMGNTRTWR